jgi:integrase
MSPRKRATRRAKGAGYYYYDKATKQHQWTIEYQGRRYRVKDRNEEAARVRFAELTHRLTSGTDVQGARTLLADYLPRYINTEVAARTKQSTVDDNHNRADLYILPTLGRYALEDIKRRHVVAWVDGMMNTPDDKGRYWSRNSVKQALGLLRRALGAVVPEFLEYNLAADVEVPTRRKGDEYKIDALPVAAKVFTPEQVSQFLAEVQRTDHQHGLYVYYVLLSELGPRRGEGLGLRRKDINFEAKTITIAQQVIQSKRTRTVHITTPKTDAGVRELPVSDETLALLRVQCVRSGAARPYDLVFPDRNGQRRLPDSVSQHFRRVCRRLGWTGYTLHSLRKVAITDWRTSGVDLEVAAAMAGHKGVRVTAETYSQPTMDRKRAAVEKKKAK